MVLWREMVEQIVCLWDWLAGLHRNVEQAPMGLHRLLPIFLFSFLIRLGLGSN